MNQIPGFVNRLRIKVIKLTIYYLDIMRKIRSLFAAIAQNGEIPSTVIARLCITSKLTLEPYPYENVDTWIHLEIGSNALYIVILLPIIPDLLGKGGGEKNRSKGNSLNPSALPL